MIVLQIISLIFWMLAVPCGLGILPCLFLPKEERTPGTLLIGGYLIQFALFELVGIPVVITAVYHGFTKLCVLYGGIAILLLLVSGYLAIRAKKRGELRLTAQPLFKDCGLFDRVCLILFLLLVALQMYMAFTRASFDGDDAYYGVQGLIAQQHDTLYRINPNTGRSAPLDTRHAMALMPILEAFWGKVSGIHMTIIAHSVTPLLLIPLSYVLYYEIGKKLFGSRRYLIPGFLLLMALFQLFGNVSIYTTETFFLTRTWQGKSLCCSFMLPAVFWLFLCLFSKNNTAPEAAVNPNVTAAAAVVQSGASVVAEVSAERRSSYAYFALLACLNLASGVSSSLGVLLTCLLTAGLGVLFALKEKKLSVLIKTWLTCLPGAAYVLTYLVITHF